MNTEQRLIAALRALIEAAPAYRSKPIGADGSYARQQQQVHIAAEDAALAAIRETECSSVNPASHAGHRPEGG